MKLRAVVFTALSLFVAQTTLAEKVRGFLWQASPSLIVVEGQKIRLAPETKIERDNQKDITAKDLRVGWEVEVDYRGDGELVARKVKVKNARFEEEKINGIVDAVNHTRFWVDGDEIRMTKGVVPAEL